MRNYSNRPDTTISVLRSTATLARRLAAHECVMIQRLIQAALEHYLTRYDLNIKAALTSGLEAFSSAGSANTADISQSEEDTINILQGYEIAIAESDLYLPEIDIPAIEFNLEDLHIDLTEIPEIELEKFEVDLPEFDIEALLAELTEPSEIKFEDFDVDALLAALDKLE